MRAVAHSHDRGVEADVVSPLECVEDVEVVARNFFRERKADRNVVGRVAVREHLEENLRCVLKVRERVLLGGVHADDVPVPTDSAAS